MFKHPYLIITISRIFMIILSAFGWDAGNEVGGKPIGPATSTLLIAGRTTSVGVQPQATQNLPVSTQQALATVEIVKTLAPSVNRGFLGISPFSLSPHSATQMGAPVSAGVLVAQVVPGSAAGNAGLRAEDIIVELEDFLIPNTGQLSKLPITHPPGETVTVVFYRNSE